MAIAHPTMHQVAPHTWIFQALRDITGQKLPNEISAWRAWFSSSGGA